MPVPEAKKDILVRNCYAAVMLGLTPKLVSASEHLKVVDDTKRNKLVLDGGMIHIPDPDELATGWESGSPSLPDLVQNSVEGYFDRSK